MSWLNFSSWSINVKIFVIILGAFLTLNLINAPLIIESFNGVNRKAFRQVVTESALRQKEAINEDFSFVLSSIEEFPIRNLIFYYNSRTPNTKDLIENILTKDLLLTAPSLLRQAWLLDADGQAILNLANFIQPRYETDGDDYVNATDTPAFRAGELLGQSANAGRNVDIVVEQIDDRLSIQVVSAVFDISDIFIGTFVVELNNIGVFTSNIQLGANKDVYSFITSPDNGDAVITLGTTDPRFINIDTEATRSSAKLQDAQFYLSGGRRVIGFYTRLFEDFRNDVIFVVELEEAIALQDISISVLSSSTTILVFQIIFLLIAIVIINRLFVRPINIVANTIRSINAGDLTSPFPINTSDDEIGKLAETIIELRQQLHSFTSDMSARIDARTRDLQVTQEIGRVAISETNLERLMTQVVDLIVERFEQIYHAQIFLIEGNHAVLKASTGEAGQQLLIRGHRLGIGGLSVIGQVTQQHQSIIARDTAASEVHHQNEFLQDTRTELAIPIRLGSQVIGALDVQSTIRDAFDEDLVTIMETMTAQIAIAIENSRLYEQSQRRLQEFEQATRQRTQNNWADFMYSQRSQQIMTHAGALMVNDFSSLRQHATETRQIAIGTITDRDTIPIAIPIIIREQILGILEWEITEPEFNQNRILLAEELASRLAISLDNARLVQVGRQTADNERIINTISAKISGQTDIEQILQTAIQEVGQALRAPRVNIQLQQPSANGNGHQDNGQPPTSNT
jgi:GAF domain-containing protein/HAMP domain-containing protein